MLHFADFTKETTRLETADHYQLVIHYDPQDETELVIRLLSFGPFIEVIEPTIVRQQLVTRLSKQLSLSSVL